MSEPLTDAKMERLTEIRNKSDLRMGFDRDDCDYLLVTIASLTAERDGAMRGAREGTAALTAERDALLVRVAMQEQILQERDSTIAYWKAERDALLERVERLEGALWSLRDWPWSPHITSEVARAALTPEPGEPE